MMPISHHYDCIESSFAHFEHCIGCIVWFDWFIWHIWYQVPLLPPAISGSSSACGLEAPPFLFKAGPTSAAMKEAEDRLTCRVSGAVWLKKLTGDAQNDKKRAKPADLTEEKAAKKPKESRGFKSRKGQGESKGEGSGSDFGRWWDHWHFAGWHPVSSCGKWLSSSWISFQNVAWWSVCSDYGSDQELPECACPTGTSSSWIVCPGRLDCCGGIVGLRFGLEGKAKLKKKVYKEWSKLRPALQSFLKQGLDTLSAQQKAALPQASSVQDLLSNLIQEVGASEAEQQLATLTTSANPQQAYAVAKEILADKESLQKVEKFIEKNNSHHCQQHLAYSTILKTIKESLCECPSPACNLHHDCHTLQDLLWGVHKSFMVLAEDEATTFCREIGLVGAACLVVGATVLQTVKNKQNSSRPRERESGGEMGRLGRVQQHCGWSQIYLCVMCLKSEFMFLIFWEWGFIY